MIYTPPAGALPTESQCWAYLATVMDPQELMDERRAVTVERALSGDAGALSYLMWRCEYMWLEQARLDLLERGLRPPTEPGPLEALEALTPLDPWQRPVPPAGPPAADEGTPIPLLTLLGALAALAL